MKRPHYRHPNTLEYAQLIYMYSIYTGCFRKKVVPLKLFWNIFISVKSFCVKFCKFDGSSYPHIFTIFYRFILKFHQTAFHDYP